jgi:cytochrome c-type biogenesis protein CcmE
MLVLAQLFTLTLLQNSTFYMNKTAIIALIIIAASLGVIIAKVGDFSQDTTFATADSNPSKSYQIVGTLALDKPMVYNPEQNANLFTFFVTDKEGKQSKVVFYGSKPMDFERSESVTLTGKMTDGVFECSKILTKCPSKYQNDQEFVAKQS